MLSKYNLAVKMEISREHFRAMIFYDFKMGESIAGCFSRLQTAFGEQAPSRATVYNWFNEFQRGRFSLSDDERSGRPLTAVTAENIERVRNMVRNDDRVTFEEIQESLGIGSSSVFTILHTHLKVSKVCSRWIPHFLKPEEKEVRVDWCLAMLKKYENADSKRLSEIVTGDETWIYQYDPETKRQSTVWVFQDEAPPTKTRRARSAGKCLVATFFSASGHVATIPLTEQRTVTAKWYTEVCLPQVFQILKDRRPKSGMRGYILHHDNATAHTAKLTLAFLEEEHVKLLGHPPYSPDLAPCDFFLFPTIKNKLKGTKFSSPDEAVAAYEEALKALSKEEWKNCILDWFHRMKRCVEANGEYFEKL